LFVKVVTFRGGFRQEVCGIVTNGCQVGMGGGILVRTITTAAASNG
jgi:hypothetical protein